MGTTTLRGKFDETDEFGDSADLTKFRFKILANNLKELPEIEIPGKEPERRYNESSEFGRKW